MIEISLKCVPKGPIDKKQSISLDNGLAPNRRQAIIWTNADPIRWRIYVAPGEYELKGQHVAYITYGLSIDNASHESKFMLN